MADQDFLLLESKIIDELKKIHDPEIPVNIYDLGLIYEIRVKDNNDVLITMTLTSPNCPVAESLPVDVKNGIAAIHGVANVEVEITFDPPWSRDMMTEAARLDLGFL